MKRGLVKRGKTISQIMMALARFPGREGGLVLFTPSKMKLRLLFGREEDPREVATRRSQKK